MKEHRIKVEITRTEIATYEFYDEDDMTTEEMVDEIESGQYAPISSTVTDEDIVVLESP